MTDDTSFPQARFACNHCEKPILIRMGLPPTTAPCPHCGGIVTSPDYRSQEEKEAVFTEKLEPISEKPVEEQNEAEVPQVAEQSAKSPTTALPELAEESMHRTDQLEEAVSENVKAVERKGKIPVLPAIIVAVLAVCGVVVWALGNFKNEEEKPSSSTEDIVVVPPSPPSIPPIEAPVEKDWESETAQLLGDFLTATSPEEKMQYVIPNNGVLEDLESYFPAGENTYDTPSFSFNFREGNTHDNQRGIYLMTYRSSADIGMQEYFKPVENMDAVLNGESHSMMEMASHIDENKRPQAMAIHAFFKNTEKGLKLDSSVFIQSKFRTFQAFTQYPQPGKSKVFRVAISETLSHALRDDDTCRSYRLYMYYLVWLQ